MADKPIDDDIRFDDQEFDPAFEPESAKAWLNLLEESEDAFESWNNHCDYIERQFASLERLASMGRDKQFALFWANAEVLKPAIYARPPVPVVVPKFNDRRAVYQAASETMERCAIVAFDLAYINEIMIQVRDDVALLGRGVPWCRYESGKRDRDGKGNDGGSYSIGEKICFDFKYRRDFLHSVSRCWYEVTWVAAASYLTRAEARERFFKHSGTAYQEAEYTVDRDTKEVGGADNRERAKFWEIWHKSENRVVWVAKGCEDILDEADPHLSLQGFFPCPKPAYGTCQFGSLVPVPDVMQYRDQLEEVNLLTGRIHALSDALEVKGFYPSGGGEIAEAIDAAVAIKTPGRVMVPISNWAAFGGSKEIVIWMPIDMIAECITAIVTLRKQIIDDIYQIMGLSDIMRGATDARETLGAQELKTQFGSSRIRDKQHELVRVARDLVCITAEIIVEKFSSKTIIEMSQSQLPREAEQQQQVAQIQQQMNMAMMAAQQQAPPPQGVNGQGMNGHSINGQGANPSAQLQQQLQQGTAQIQKILSKPNIEQVLTFLHDNKARAFTLDIETDSTILADENGEKQRRTEFVGMLGTLLPQLGQMITSNPKTAEFCGELLKFATAPFRAGRSMDGAIDDLIEQIKTTSDQPRPDDPTTATNKTALQIEQIKQARQAEKDKADTVLKQAELQMKDRHEQMKVASNEKLKLIELQAKKQDEAAKAQQTNMKMMADREKHQADMVGKQFDMQMNAQKMDMARQSAQHKQEDMQTRAGERQAAQAFKQSQQPPEGFPS